VARLAPPGPILDVGAGNGALVRALRRQGRSAIGIERPRTGSTGEAAPVVARRDGPAVVTSEIGAVSGPWAGVVFWHSLEHLPAAAADLDRAVKLLAPGGLLVVAIPNPASFQARVFGAKWFGRDIPRHLVHVPPGALVARLRQSGLDVRRVSHWRGGQVVFGWLDGLVKVLPGQLALYDAIRRADAREESMGIGRTVASIVSAVLLTPVAVGAAAFEVAARSGGTFYVEAFG
jgi:SAM-dependent methyltransferase